MFCDNFYKIACMVCNSNLQAAHITYVVYGDMTWKPMSTIIRALKNL